MYIGDVGALYKLNKDTKEVIPVCTFLNWSIENESGQKILTAQELYVVTWPVQAPFHGALFADEVLYLCDGISSWNEGVQGPTGDFISGPFCCVVGYIYERIPPFTAKQWLKTLKSGKLYEGLMIATEARLTQGKDPIGLLDLGKSGNIKVGE